MDIGKISVRKFLVFFSVSLEKKRSNYIRSRLETMRQIYNCEQISIPRAISSNDMNDSSTRQAAALSDSRHSSFDDSIPTPTVKGQFDFTPNARFVEIEMTLAFFFRH